MMMPTGGYGRPPEFPPTAPVVRHEPYSTLKDPVIWLLGMAAPLAQWMLSGVPLRWDNPYNSGFSTGRLVGGFFVFTGVGLLICKIGSWMGARSPTIRRISFAFCAIGLASLAGIGERVRQQRIAEYTDSTQQFANEVRTQLDHPGSALAPEISSADADQGKRLMTEGRKFFEETIAAGRAYQARVAGIVGEGFLQPSNLDSAEKIAGVRSKLTTLKQMVDEHEKDSLTLMDDFPRRVMALPLDGSTKQAAIAGYRQTVTTSESIVKSMADADRRFVQTSGAVLDFLDSRMGHFQVVVGKIYFDEAEDSATYNRLIRQVQTIISDEGKLTKQAQQSVQQGLNAMTQAVSAK